MRLYVATTNAGKLREMAALFPAPFEPVRWDRYESPLEGDVSYADNAALKARALHAQLRRAGIQDHVLADDSGLEVAAFGGRPGVLTAYYGGAELGWADRRRRLVEELAAQGGADRRARFVCALHLVAAGGRELAAMATVDGEIATEDRGALGFSFDPVFVYPPAGKTFGEMTDEEKNGVSHRAIAAAALRAAIARAGIAEE